MLKKQQIFTIPSCTQKVAKNSFPKGNEYMLLRDSLGSIYTDEDFAEMYPNKGQPALHPWRLALVTVMQFMENLSDRQAANAVRARLDWKYALGLELDDAGFDFSVLSEFRQRLIGGEKESILLDTILEKADKKGLMKGQDIQRTDATHILAGIRRMNRLEMVGETMKRALDDMAREAPEWLVTHIKEEWAKKYGHRVEAYRLPKSKKAQKELAKEIGEDGFFLLQAVFSKDAPKEIRKLRSVENMRQIWVQQYYLRGNKVFWRTRKKEGLPPANLMISSPDDTEARYSGKRGSFWTGYKVHLTETCDAEQPRLITHVATTPATTHDKHVIGKIQDDLQSKNRSPKEHLVDGGYTDVDILLQSMDKEIDLIAPLPANTSWQARTEGAYDPTHFNINWNVMQAICPQGKISTSHKKHRGRSGKITVYFSFSKADCASCATRSRCTKAKKDGRQIAVFPQEKYELLLAARQRQKTVEFKKLYALRSGAEGTIAQAINKTDIRHTRYRGVKRTHLQNIASSAAINLARIANWLSGNCPKATRTSPFLKLALQT